MKTIPLNSEAAGEGVPETCGKHIAQSFNKTCFRPKGHSGQHQSDPARACSPTVDAMRLAEKITWFEEGHCFTSCPEHWTKSVAEIIEVELGIHTDKATEPLRIPIGYPDYWPEDGGADPDEVTVDEAAVRRAAEKIDEALAHSKDYANLPNISAITKIITAGLNAHQPVQVADAKRQAQEILNRHYDFPSQKLEYKACLDDFAAALATQQTTPSPYVEEDKNSASGASDCSQVVVPKDIQLDTDRTMTFEYCPSCAGELDTGFECLKCNRDWRPWATVYFDLKEVEQSQ